MYIIDLLSPTSIEIINSIYNLEANSPTTISIYYQENIKKTPLINEFNVIIDLLKQSQKTIEINTIKTIIDEINEKVEKLENFLQINENQFDLESVEEKNNIKTFISTLKSVVTYSIL